MSDVIQKWLDSVFFTKNFNQDLISPDFCIEDGMSISEYWEYELDSANRFSKIFDINNSVYYKTIFQYTIEKNKVFKIIYVYNHLDKIVFKMNICTDSNNEYIKSNNFYTQIVPKFKISNGVPYSVSLAVKSKKPIKSVISPDSLVTNVCEGLNFNKDGFYTVELGEVNNGYSLTLRVFFCFVDGTIERRNVYIDLFNSDNIPYEISEQGLFTLSDKKYPVNLALFFKDETNRNIIYPRGFSINLNQVEKIIVTDVLDNDWHIISKD